MRYLSPLAESEIESLQSEGIQLTADDIVRINALAHRVESPKTRLSLSRGTPIAIGGATLWPMTLAGSDWFQRVGGQLHGEKKQTYALAYAMSKGRESLPEELSEADTLVDKWGRSLRCRHSELIEAIRQVHAQWERVDSEEESGGESSSCGEISMMLTAMTGLAPAVWEYQCSIPYVLEMLETMVAQKEADGQSSRHDPKMKAERALGLAVHKIRERHLKDVSNG